MENMPLYSLTAMRSMEVIDVNTGTKLGYIRDVKLDCENYRVVSILIPSMKMSWFSKNDFIEIPWENVQKVGVDVILVDGGSILEEKKS